MYDDRKQFAEQQVARSRAMADDTELVHRAFELQADAARHGFTYLWNWLGVPIIQMPPDIVVTQEIIWATRPDIIIETGVARGGSLILSASILRLLGGNRRVLGIDIDIRAANRETIETHPLSDAITLLDGSSIAPETLAKVTSLIPLDSRVMVILDSDHSHDHVLAELKGYSPFVTPGAYLIVADTGLARPESSRLKIRDWTVDNNPATAIAQFMQTNSCFEPDPFFNNKLLMTSSPGGYLKRIRA